MSRDCNLLYVRTFPWSYRVSCENGCKTVLMRIVTVETVVPNKTLPPIRGA